MKTSRLLLAAVPAGLFVVGALALGKWSYRNVFGASSTARADQRPGANDNPNPDDRVTPIPGSAAGVAGVAEAMAEEGGPVLVTEVASVGGDEVVIAETLLVPSPHDA